MKISTHFSCRFLLGATLVAGSFATTSLPNALAAPALSTSALSAPHVAGQLLVKFAPSLSASDKAHLLSQVGGTTLRTFSTGWSLVKVASIETAIKKLTSNTSVASIQPNFTFRAPRPIQSDGTPVTAGKTTRSSTTPNDPYYSTQWALQKIGAPQAWKTTTGSDNVVVAVFDTGIDIDHPDLKANIWTNTKEIPGNGIDDDHDGYIDDVHGWSGGTSSPDVSPSGPHGSHVAGIIGAAGNNRTGIAGINWRVKILPVRWSDNIGNYTVAGIIGGIDYILALRKRGVNVRAVNCSFVYSYLGPYAEGDSFKALSHAGVLIVRAAGNDAVNSDTEPDQLLALDLPNLISVGASDYNDNKAEFSDYGFKRVHIFAPGRGIISTVYDSPTGLANYSGTSMAAPMVTGAAALLWSVQPNLSARQVKARLIASATHVDQLRPFVTDGRRLNLAGLINNATHTIRGRVSTPIDTGDGKPRSSALANVSLFLDNSKTPAATTDAQGNYVITGVSGGAHTLVPKLAGTTFTPSPVNLPTDKAASPTTVTVNFVAQTAQSKLYTIAVSVSQVAPDYGTTPRPDVNIYLNDSSTPAGHTDKDGKLNIGRLPAGNYSVRAVDSRTGEEAPDVRFFALPDPFSNGNVAVNFVYPVPADREAPRITPSTVLTSNTYTLATAPTTFTGTATDESGVDYLYSLLFRFNSQVFEIYDSTQKKWVNYEDDLEYARILGKKQKDPKSFDWKFTLPKLESGYTYGFAVDAIDIKGNATTQGPKEEAYYEFTVLDSDSSAASAGTASSKSSAHGS